MVLLPESYRWHAVFVTARSAETWRSLLISFLKCRSESCVPASSHLLSDIAVMKFVFVIHAQPDMNMVIYRDKRRPTPSYRKKLQDLNDAGHKKRQGVRFFRHDLFSYFAFPQCRVVWDYILSPAHLSLNVNTYFVHVKVEHILLEPYPLDIERSWFAELFLLPRLFTATSSKTLPEYSREMVAVH